MVDCEDAESCRKGRNEEDKQSNFRAEGHDTVVYWSGYIEASIRTESLRARERKVLYSIVNLKPQKNMHRHRLMLWGLCFSGWWDEECAFWQLVEPFTVWMESWWTTFLWNIPIVWLGKKVLTRITKFQISVALWGSFHSFCFKKEKVLIQGELEGNQAHLLGQWRSEIFPYVISIFWHMSALIWKLSFLAQIPFSVPETQGNNSVPFLLRFDSEVSWIKRCTEV